MDESLFTPLADAGLTSLRVHYDWRADEHRLWAAKEWEAGHDFAAYNDTFDAQTILTTSARYLDDGAVRDLFARHHLASYLDRVVGLLRRGRHVAMEVYFEAERDIRFICHQHSRRQGLRSRRRAILAGGIRRHAREEPELDVIVDGLNLSRAMTFKNIAARLEYGGCKTTVQMDELDLSDLGALGFLAFAIDRSRSMTGPDMNFPTEMSDVINEHFSPQFTSGPKSPMGESGRPTAYGTVLALEEAVRFGERRDSLRGLSVVIMGLGSVGWHLAELLAEKGMKLAVADIDVERAAAFVVEHPEADVTRIGVEEVLDAEADILCLAAIGGLIDDAVVDRLRFRYVFGPANNQLKATSQAEEERLARRLAGRGILFQTEWWHNTAGVMSAAEEYAWGQEASLERLRERIEQTIPARTRENLQQAAARGITPTENAYRSCVEVIYGTEH